MGVSLLAMALGGAAGSVCAQPIPSFEVPLSFESLVPERSQDLVLRVPLPPFVDVYRVSDLVLTGASQWSLLPGLTRPARPGAFAGSAAPLAWVEVRARVRPMAAAATLRLAPGRALEGAEDRATPVGAPAEALAAIDLPHPDGRLSVRVLNGGFLLRFGDYDASDEREKSAVALFWSPPGSEHVQAGERRLRVLRPAAAMGGALLAIEHGRLLATAEGATRFGWPSGPAQRFSSLSVSERDPRILLRTLSASPLDPPADPFRLKVIEGASAPQSSPRPEGAVVAGSALREIWSRRLPSAQEVAMELGLQLRADALELVCDEVVREEVASLSARPQLLALGRGLVRLAGLSARPELLEMAHRPERVGGLVLQHLAAGGRWSEPLVGGLLRGMLVDPALAAALSAWQVPAPQDEAGGPLLSALLGEGDPRPQIATALALRGELSASLRASLAPILRAALFRESHEGGRGPVARACRRLLEGLSFEGPGMAAATERALPPALRDLVGGRRIPSGDPAGSLRLLPDARWVPLDFAVERKMGGGLTIHWRALRGTRDHAFFLQREDGSERSELPRMPAPAAAGVRQSLVLDREASELRGRLLVGEALVDPAWADAPVSAPDTLPLPELRARGQLPLTALFPLAEKPSPWSAALAAAVAVLGLGALALAARPGRWREPTLRVGAGRPGGLS